MQKIINELKSLAIGKNQFLFLDPTIKSVLNAFRRVQAKFKRVQFSDEQFISAVVVFFQTRSVTTAVKYILIFFLALFTFFLNHFSSVPIIPG